MPTEFVIGRFPEGLVVRIVGRGTMQESLAFRAAVQHCPVAGAVVFDARQCDYVDSTFLGCLIWVKKACEKPPQRSFSIVASDATRIRLFSTSVLGGYFHFVEACPERIDTLLSINVEHLTSEQLARHIMRCHALLADMGGENAGAFKAVAERLAAELGVDEPASMLEQTHWK